MVTFMLSCTDFWIISDYAHNAASHTKHVHYEDLKFVSIQISASARNQTQELQHTSQGIQDCLFTTVNLPGWHEQ